MRVLGIDCGGEYTGYGVVEQDDLGTLHHLCYRGHSLVAARGTGAPPQANLRRTARRSSPHTLPEQVAIEDVFYAVNAKSALKLGHVRGVAMLVAAQAGLEVVAYSPLSIKSAVVGYGRAEKSQVQIMVARLLNLAGAAPAPRRRRCSGHRHLPSAYRRHLAAPGCRALIESLSRMKRLCLLLLLLTGSLAACAAAAPRQHRRRPTGVTYLFDWPQGIPWTKYSITVQSDGKTHFSGTPHPDDKDTDTDPVEQDFTMWENNRQKIFELAQKLNYFQGRLRRAHQAHRADRQ